MKIHLISIKSWFKFNWKIYEHTEKRREKKEIEEDMSVQVECEQCDLDKNIYRTIV